MSIVWNEEMRKRQSEKAEKAWKRPETRKYQCKRMKEAWSNPELRKQFGERIKRAYDCPEARRHLKEARNRPDIIERQRKKMREFWSRPEARKAIRETWGNPETKKAQSEKIKRYWEKISPEERKKYALRASKAIKFVSKGEAALYEIIRQHYPRARSSRWIAGYQADIVLYGFKINIEYDGIYWHRNPEKDKARDELLQKQGWTVLRIREGEAFDIDVLHKLIEEKRRVA